MLVAANATRAAPHEHSTGGEQSFALSLTPLEDMVAQVEPICLSFEDADPQAEIRVARTLREYGGQEEATSSRGRRARA